MVNEMTRKCRTCKEIKNLTEFTRRPKAPQGREYQCKACRSKARFESSSYIRERFRKHVYRHNTVNLYTEATIEEVLSATNCAYCDVEMTRGKRELTEATVDHVYLGHNIDENVVVCCRSCNSKKHRQHVYDFYQSSEKFTDKLWYEFVKRFASRFLKHEANEQEIEAWKLGFKVESEEMKRYGA